MAPAPDFASPAPVPRLADAGNLAHLVYSSRAPAPLTTPQLEALLDTSRQNNHRHGITGLLVHTQGRFMQCLEGPRDAVTATFARIATDARHADVEVLLYEAVAVRSFAAWDMACTEVGESAWLRLATARWKSHLQHLPGESSGFTLMEHIWTGHGVGLGMNEA